jgi:Fe-S oxidoreductase
MSVYVDCSRNRFGRMIMCHMVADTPDELHAMAKQIGMRREWFQPKSTPHYDVCLMRRAKAIEFGAIVVDRRAFVDVIRRNRTSDAWRTE